MTGLREEAWVTRGLVVFFRGCGVREGAGIWHDADGRSAVAPLGLIKFAFPLSSCFNLLMIKTDSLFKKY